MVNRHDNKFNLGLIAILFFIACIMYFTGVRFFIVINCAIGACVMLIERIMYMYEPFERDYLAKSYITLFVVLSVGQIWLPALMQWMRPDMAEPLNMVCKTANVFLCLAWIVVAIVYVLNGGFSTTLF